MPEMQRRGWLARERARILAESYAADVGLGIMAGTKVATAVGWRPVEALKAGDKVLTFENRMQPVDWIERRILWCGRNADPGVWPLFVPARALGNREDMFLMPAQSIVIDSDLAERVFGAPYVLVPAAALVGHFGIARELPEKPLEIVRFGFAAEEVVFANTGAMFHCAPRADVPGEVTDGGGNYTVLAEEAADHFLTCLEQGNYPVRTRN